jgi:hypothetical protein
MTSTLLEPATTLLEPAALSLKVLWAEDIFEDLSGDVDLLEYRGHSVLKAFSCEEAEDYLRTCIIDVLVVDQQLPWQDQWDDEAGSRLVGRLKDGDLGELNRDVPFLFITGSREWVLGAEVDVTQLQGFLDIEEKGDDITGCLGRYLGELRPREVVGPTLEGEVAGSESSRGVPPGISVIEQWLGVVTAVGDATFDAWLEDVSGEQEEHLASFLLETVSPAEREMVVEDAQFIWLLGHRDQERAGRETVAKLQFLSIDPPTPQDVADSADAVTRIDE